MYDSIDNITEECKKECNNRFYYGEFARAWHRLNTVNLKDIQQKKKITKRDLYNLKHFMFQQIELLRDELALKPSVMKKRNLHIVPNGFLLSEL